LPDADALAFIESMCAAALLPLRLIVLRRVQC
jgi:hypothetical protein